MAESELSGFGILSAERCQTLAVARNKRRPPQERPKRIEGRTAEDKPPNSKANTKHRVERGVLCIRESLFCLCGFVEKHGQAGFRAGGGVFLDDILGVALFR